VSLRDTAKHTTVLLYLRCGAVKGKCGALHGFVGLDPFGNEHVFAVAVGHAPCSHTVSPHVVELAKWESMIAEGHRRVAAGRKAESYFLPAISHQSLKDLHNANDGVTPKRRGLTVVKSVDLNSIDKPGTWPPDRAE
jgi:hypothetical protein